MRADEWADVRRLRLAALLDDAAPIAFLDTHEHAAALSDDFWRERTAAASADTVPPSSARQFVVIDSRGEWVATATALRETAGETDFEGRPVERNTFHLVGVYVRPENRGGGLLQKLLATAAGWGEERWGGQARLYVHAANLRAQRAYTRAGFAQSGVQFESSIGPSIEMMRPAGWID